MMWELRNGLTQMKLYARIQGNEGVAGLTSSRFNVLKTLAWNCGQNAGQGVFKSFTFMSDL